jgi:Zn-dependent protease with chaperone function
MIAATVLLGYAVAAAWFVPVLLTPLTSSGVSPRLGLTAWLAAMGSVITALVLGANFAARTAAAEWPQLTTALCRSVAGGVCSPQVYRSALYEAGVTLFAAAVVLLLAVALWRYGRRVQLGSAGSRSHARAALLVGQDIASAAPAAGAAGAGEAIGIARRVRAVMLDDPRPAAYCVPGRPAAIVLTSGALAVLDRPQLAAVLCHERAHLAGRHHALLLLARGLTAAFPSVPLFSQGAAEISRLSEMAADDAASRAHSRATVAAALVALANGMATPGLRVLPQRGMAAAAYAVPARVERLLRPPDPALAAAFALGLAVLAAALCAIPMVLACTA